MYPQQYPAQMEGLWEDIRGAVSGVVGVVGSALTSMPAVSDAVNYVKRKVGEFFGLPARIAKAARRAQELKQIAQMKNLSKEAAELGAIQSALVFLQGKYNETEAKVSPLLEQLKASGFGLAPLIPIAIISAAVAVAAAMAYLFKGVSFNEQLLDKVEKKVITPAEATALFGPRPFLGIDFGKILLPAGLVVGGLFALRAIRQR